MKNLLQISALILIISSCAAPSLEPGRIGNVPTDLKDCDGLYEQEYERCIEEVLLSKPK